MTPYFITRSVFFLLSLSIAIWMFLKARKEPMNTPWELTFTFLAAVNFACAVLIFVTWKF